MTILRVSSGMRHLLLCLCVVTAVASENDWFRPLGPPPKAAPRRISGGESFPPLPLPATPLRRSERKRQPSPPPLFGKLVWGEAATFTFDDGNSTDIADWNLCPADLQGLLAKTRQALGEPFGSEPVSLADFHGDPQRLPAVLVSGVRSLRLGDAQSRALRDYVLRGGMLVFDSVAGSPFFTESARQVIAGMFPDRPLRRIPADHPLFHLVTDVDKAGFGRNPPGTEPWYEGVYVGSRVGVLLSPYGLGCGWDDREVPDLPQAVFYDVATATRLGANLAAYAIGWANVGIEEARPELFGALDERPPGGEFVFAQLRHAGHWDVHPGAAVKLLAGLRRDSALAVHLKRVAVTPGLDDLGSYPALWLTGLDAPAFDERARAALRAYLAGPGTLIAVNGLGLAAFDRALRPELAALLPGVRLAPLAPDHPLFTCALRLVEARYTPAALAMRPGLTQPWIEGMVVGDSLKVIYSPFDLCAGWDGIDRPGIRAWDPASAITMGTNLVVWAATH
jgi:hypothetical protein